MIDYRPVRRLARILLNAMTALSLLLFLATVALKVRSHWRLHDLNYIAERRMIAGANCRDGLALFWDSTPRLGMRAEEYGPRHSL